MGRRGLVVGKKIDLYNATEAARLLGIKRAKRASLAALVKNGTLAEIASAGFQAIPLYRASEVDRLAADRARQANND